MKYLFICLYILLATPLQANEKIIKDNPKNTIILTEIQLIQNGLLESKTELNLIHDEIKEVNLQNKELLTEINRQNSHIIKLIKLNEASDFFKEFIYPILLSIIAAIIFWFSFSYVPERSRKTKIRTKLDLNISQVYNRLFALFDLIMSHSEHSPSFFQEEIKGNKLKKSDIELGLQNKCLNEHYFFDTSVKDTLLPIGKQLHEIIKEIDINIERIFNFGMYISSEEILLLEEIKTQLHIYDLADYNKEAVTVIGNQRFHPVNPSLSYMRNNIFDLFTLYIKLQNMVFNNKLEYQGLFLTKIQHYFYCGEYEKCIDLDNKQSKKHPNEKDLSNKYAFLSIYFQGKHDLAYAKLINILSEKPHLVPIRGFFRDIVSDKKIRKIIHNHYSNNELKEFYQVVKKEEMQKKIFIKTARKLQDYYINKTTNNIAQTEISA